MRLREIQGSEFFTSDQDARQRVITRYQSKGNFNHIGKVVQFDIESMDVDGGIKYWFLVIEDEPVGMVMLKPTNIASDTKFCVSWLWVGKQYRGQGLVKELYLKMVDSLGSVVSDYDQTAGSMSVWRSLFGHGEMFGLRFIDGEGEKWQPIESKDELEKTWSEDKYHRLMIAKE